MNLREFREINPPDKPDGLGAVLEDNEVELLFILELPQLPKCTGVVENAGSPDAQNTVMDSNSTP